MQAEKSSPCGVNEFGHIMYGIIYCSVYEVWSDFYHKSLRF